MNNMFKYYNNLVEKCLKNKIKYSTDKGIEGWHDCIVIDIHEESNIEYEGRVYIPSFIIFYDYIQEDGDLISKKETGSFDEIYSFTNEGYGEGLYLNKDMSGEEKELFNKILKLIK